MPLLDQIFSLIETYNPVTVSALASVLSALAGILNIGVLILGLVLPFILHYFLLKKRSEKDRIYQTNYDFYQKLIINNIELFIKISVDFNKVIDEIHNRDDLIEYMDRMDAGAKRIDEEYFNFERIALPIVRCYSNDFHEDFAKEAEILYDNAYISITNVALIAEGRDSIEKIKTDYLSYKEQYLTSLFNLISKHKPNPLEKKPQRPS